MKHWSRSLICEIDSRQSHKDQKQKIKNKDPQMILIFSKKLDTTRVLHSNLLLSKLMTTDYSKEAFLKFLDYLSNKGLIKFQTVRGWRSAALKLMADLSETEEADIRTIDLDLAVHKTANRDSASVSPKSLNTYRSRVALAIGEFTSWSQDPARYKPRGLNGTTRAKPSNERVNPQERAIKGTPKASEKREAETMTPTGLTLSFPLRSDFLAQVVIPRDLTAVEARRLGAFLLTIAVDYQPE